MVEIEPFMKILCAVALLLTTVDTSPPTLGYYVFDVKHTWKSPRNNMYTCEIPLWIFTKKTFLTK